MSPPEVFVDPLAHPCPVERDARAHVATSPFVAKNPLELGAALLFGVLFLALLVVTHFAALYLGRLGLYTLAAVMGVTDVDPFIMSMTQSAGSAVPVMSAGVAIVLAASSNNVIKGIYAYSASDRQTGVMSLLLLVSLSIVGLVPLAWV